MRKLFYSLILFAFFSSHYAEGVALESENDTLSILTIGNSFARNACEFLDEIVASAVGLNIKITRANIGGCSLEKHANLIDSCVRNPDYKPYPGGYSLQDLLLLDEYDVVTIQQVSSQSYKSESYQPFADKLVAFIKKFTPRTTILVHQTWSYHPESQRLKDWSLERDEMHIRLSENYNNLAERYNTIELPSGDAFNHSFIKNHEINLWADDGYHASKAGCYLAGLTWFAVLFDESPKKVKFKPSDMSRKTAKSIRKSAYQAVKEINYVHPDL